MEQLSAGVTLQGRYVVDRVLGRGGMGAVYLARHTSLGNRPVAIKAMSIPYLDPEDRARAGAQFRAEAEILSRLRHPGLVAVFDFFVERDQEYLVMELVDGKTLADVLDEQPSPPPLARILDWADQLCDVLEYLHSQQPPVLFRDLKPTNVMLDGSDRIKVIDFGIARPMPEQGRTATFIRGAGTPGFAPVEQMGQGRTDARSDVYALGATLYSLLTKTLPPPAVDLMTGDAALTPPSRLNPSLPPAVDAVIERMMAPRKEHRFQTVGEARQHLARSRSGGAPPPPPPASSLPPTVVAPPPHVPAPTSLARDLGSPPPAPAQAAEDGGGGVGGAVVAIIICAVLGWILYAYGQKDRKVVRTPGTSQVHSTATPTPTPEPPVRTATVDYTPDWTVIVAEATNPWDLADLQARAKADGYAECPVIDGRDYRELTPGKTYLVLGFYQTEAEGNKVVARAKTGGFPNAYLVKLDR